MSRRNPLNDRYQQTDDQKASSGTKRAASAKPKTKAASSVTVVTGKTPQQKKAERKAQEKKEQERSNQYRNPPTARYKMLTRLWIGLLVAAIACTILVWVLQGRIPDVGMYVLLAGSYGCIIGALFVDFSLRRKERRRYQAEMEAKKASKHETMKNGAKRPTKAEAEAAQAAAAAEETPKKRGLFGRKKEA